MRSNSAFGQRDPRWSDVPLGTYGGHTLGTAGCLVSVAAGMLVDVVEEEIDPGRLNRWLCRAGGFVNGNLVSFGALEAFGLSGVVIDCYSWAAPMDEVAVVLGECGGVLALVDFIPGGSVNQHWVRILRLDGDDAWMHDPWLPPGVGPYWMMPRYGHYMWDGPARTIFRLAMYLPDAAVMARAVAGVDGVAMTPARDARQGAVFCDQR